MAITLDSISDTKYSNEETKFYCYHTGFAVIVFCFSLLIITSQ